MLIFEISFSASTITAISDYIEYKYEYDYGNLRLHRVRLQQKPVLFPPPPQGPQSDSDALPRTTNGSICTVFVIPDEVLLQCVFQYEGTMEQAVQISGLGGNELVVLYEEDP